MVLGSLGRSLTETLFFFYKLIIFGCTGSSLPLGLCSSCSEQGLLLVDSVRASLVAEHRLQGTHTLVVAVCGLSWGTRA